MELHDFHADDEIPWGRSFHENSVELCLNLSGHGTVGCRGAEARFDENTAGIYAHIREPLQASRPAGQRHRFVTFEYSQAFLERAFAGAQGAANTVVQESVFQRRVQSAVGGTRPLTTPQEAFALSIAQPPVAPALLPLWYESKALEGVAVFLSDPTPELFCTRQKRLDQERAARVRNILRSRLAEPPSLEQLSKEVGVSQFHLSRTFSKETGMTIPQFLRRIRMERAAELLCGGGHNVTQAAFAVGYASLGHFSKSFCEVIGCCPTLYPQALTLVRK